MSETIRRQEMPEEEELLHGKLETIQCQKIPEEKPLQTKRKNNTDTLKS